MITNESLTIYNRKLDPETRQYVYRRTEIPNVHWYTDQKVSIGDNGLISADLYKIRIPAGRQTERFVPADKYAALPYGEEKRCWTVENGDLFVKGIVRDEITKESDLKNKHYVYGKVLSFSDNRKGRIPHIRIGGG